MSRNLNDDLIIEGVLCNDIKTKCTKTGKQLSEFLIYDDKFIEGPYVNCIAWEVLSEQLNDLNLKKGSKLEIIGYLKFNDYLKKQQFVIKEILL